MCTLVIIMLVYNFISVFSDSNRVLPNTLFVGQIPPQTTEEELKSNFPGCVSARIVTNRDISAGFSRG